MTLDNTAGPRRGSRPGHIAIALCALLMVLASPLVAQGQFIRHWSLSITGGLPLFAHATDDFEQGMIAGGLNDATPCVFLCYGDYTHPKSSGPELSPLLSLRWQLGRHTSIRGTFGGAALGRTTGYDTTTSKTLILDASVKTLGLMFGMTSAEQGGFWAAVGPAYYRALIEDRRVPSSYHHLTSKVGGVVSGGFGWPQYGALYVEAEAQYRFVGSITVDSIDLGDPSATYPRSTVRLNHALLVAGLGIRF